MYGIISTVLAGIAIGMVIHTTVFLKVSEKEREKVLLFSIFLVLTAIYLKV